MKSLSVPYQPNTFKMAGGMNYYNGDCRTPEARSQIQQQFIQVLNSSVFRMVCQLLTFRDKCKAGNVDVECIGDDSSIHTKTPKAGNIDFYLFVRDSILRRRNVGLGCMLCNSGV